MKYLLIAGVVALFVCVCISTGIVAGIVSDIVTRDDTGTDE